MFGVINHMVKRNYTVANLSIRQGVMVTWLFVKMVKLLILLREGAVSFISFKLQ